MPVGTKVPVGAVLARIGAAGRAPQPAAPRRAAAAPPAPQPPRRTPPPAPPAPAAPPRPASALRDLARGARGAPPSSASIVRGLHGSGPQGAIAVADVEARSRASAAPRAGEAPRRGFDPAAMRQAIAAAMAAPSARSRTTTSAQPIDIGRALDWLDGRATHGATVEQRLLPAVLLLKAVALGAARGAASSTASGSTALPSSATAIHVGWAIALRGGGLVAPAIHDADQLTLDQTDGGAARSRARARARRACAARR